MFNHLVESGSHKKDLARRVRFLLGTLGSYALFLMVASVASVYAYDSHLAKQNLELYTLVAPPPLPETRRPQEPESANVASGPRRNEIAQRVAAIAPLLNNTRPPDTISTVRNRLAELPKNMPYTISSRDYTPLGGGGLGNLPGEGNVPTTNRSAVVVPVDPAGEPTPPPTPTPAPVKPPDRLRLPTSVIASKVITKPAPAYPVLAKQARVQGMVTVEILIDEQGRVVSAHATSGHAFLRAAAQSSAFQARFSPTTVSGQPVKVSGVITYNFILQ